MTVKKNSINFTYNIDGTIAQIVDTLGKAAVFTYTSGRLSKIKYVYLIKKMTLH